MKDWYLVKISYDKHEDIGKIFEAHRFLGYVAELSGGSQEENDFYDMKVFLKERPYSSLTLPNKKAVDEFVRRLSALPTDPFGVPNDISFKIDDIKSGTEVIQMIDKMVKSVPCCYER